MLPRENNAAVPPWMTPELIEQARLAWKPYYGRPLSENEAIDVLLSMGALCDVLIFDSSLDKAGNAGPPAMLALRSA